MTSPDRKLTVIESPFSAPTHDEIVRNVYYAMLAVRDSLSREEAPYASHLFFTQMLDDNIPHERTLGIEAGLSIGENAVSTAVYTDLGISHGMKLGIEAAERAGRPVVERQLFMSSLTLAEIEQQIHSEVERHHLPHKDVLEAIYARIIK